MRQVNNGYNANLESLIYRLQAEKKNNTEILQQFDELPIGIQLLDEHLNSTYLNRVADDYQHQMLSEFHSTALLSGQQPSFRNIMYSSMRRVLKNGVRDVLEERFIDRNGQIMWLQFQLIRTVKGLAIIISNTTATQEVNRNLKRAYHLLRERFNTRTSQLQNKNTELMDSINYARQIQKAFLPDISQLRKSFPKSFMFLQPKDVLSGDFFWIKKSGNRSVLALADCTGHGVPGALLSIIGVQALCDAVEESFTAADILCTLDRIIQRALKQSTDINAPRDGMDISVCIFHHKEKRLEFAGANRPMWYISGTNEIQEVKGDRIAIGGRLDAGKAFSNHVLDLESGCRIFLFSDGFADQDGGVRGKKLKNKYFRQELQQLQHATIQKQGKLLQEFMVKWKGERMQLDDILVIGLEVP